MPGKKRKSPSSVILVTVSSGETDTVSNWSARTGDSLYAIYRRLKRGKPPDEAVGLVKPLKPLSLKHNLTVDGVTRTLDEWAEHFGLRENTVRNRIGAGRTHRQALGLDPHTRAYRSRLVRKIEFDGGYYAMSELIAMHGKTPQAVHQRRSRGWTLREALETPNGQVPPGREARKRGRKPDILKMEETGETGTFQEWQDRTGIPAGSLRRLVRKGLTLDEAVKVAIGKELESAKTAAGRASRRDRPKFVSLMNTPVTIGDETKTLGQWVRSVGMKEVTVRARLKRGMDYRQALKIDPKPETEE